MVRFCVTCGGLCEVKNRMSTFGKNKLWCYNCKSYTKTILISWDMGEKAVVITTDYQKYDYKPTYSLHQDTKVPQKLVSFSDKWR